MNVLVMDLHMFHRFHGETLKIKCSSEPEGSGRCPDPAVFFKRFVVGSKDNKGPWKTCYQNYWV